MNVAVSSHGLQALDAGLVRERLARTLDTVERCIPVLGVRVQECGGQAFKREKFVCETALFLYTSFRATDDPGIRRRCRELGARLAPHARGDEMLALMTLRQSMIPELCVAHVCLGHMGLPDAAFDVAIAGLLEFGCRASERVSWKDLEAAWLAAMYPAFKVPKGLATSLRRTTMAVGLDCLTATRNEMYAFTHGIIYFTDFGHQPVVPPRDLELILRDAEGALVRCMDEDDFDLVAELLMVWPFFGVAMSPVAEFCLQVLMGVEEEVGFLPSLTVNVAQIAKLDPEIGAHKLLDEAYHTIYVMGLLYASLLHGRRAAGPAESIPVAALAPGMTLPARPRGKPQWEKYHAALSPARQVRIGHFEVGVALARALQGNDLAAVHRLLMTCCDGGARYAPGAANASEIIARFATVAIQEDAGN